VNSSGPTSAMGYTVGKYSKESFVKLPNYGRKKVRIMSILRK